jgi:lipoate synthase
VLTSVDRDDLPDGGARTPLHRAIKPLPHGRRSVDAGLRQ